jgi:hypothetical protein
MLAFSIRLGCANWALSWSLLDGGELPICAAMVCLVVVQSKPRQGEDAYCKSVGSLLTTFMVILIAVYGVIAALTYSASASAGLRLNSLLTLLAEQEASIPAARALAETVSASPPHFVVGFHIVTVTLTAATIITALASRRRYE